MVAGDRYYRHYVQKKLCEIRNSRSKWREAMRSELAWRSKCIVSAAEIAAIGDALTTDKVWRIISRSCKLSRASYPEKSLAAMLLWKEYAEYILDEDDLLSISLALRMDAIQKKSRTIHYSFTSMIMKTAITRQINDRFCTYTHFFQLRWLLK